MLAQAYIKLYPTRVRAAALIGTVPLGEKIPLHHAANGDRALREMFDDCRADPACNRAYPHLAADWERLARRLAAAPVVVSTDAGPQTIRSGPFGEAVRNRLNSVFGQRGLPLLISRAAAGDFGPFLKSVQSQGPEPEADGLYLSVTCPEATRRIRATATSTQRRRGLRCGRYRIESAGAACRLWTPSRVGPALSGRSRWRADAPVVLFLSSGQDASTPTAWARAVAAGLPRSRVVIIPAMTHLPVGLANMTCLDRIIDRFFAKGSAEGLDTSCIQTMTPPPVKQAPRPVLSQEPLPTASDGRPRLKRWPQRTARRRRPWRRRVRYVRTS